MALYVPPLMRTSRLSLGSVKSSWKVALTSAHVTTSGSGTGRPVAWTHEQVEVGLQLGQPAELQDRARHRDAVAGGQRERSQGGAEKIDAAGPVLHVHVGSRGAQVGGDDARDGGLGARRRRARRTTPLRVVHVHRRRSAPARARARRGAGRSASACRRRRRCGRSERRAALGRRRGEREQGHACRCRRGSAWRPRRTPCRRRPRPRRRRRRRPRARRRTSTCDQVHAVGTTMAIRVSV